jgi:hypothetical protein
MATLKIYHGALKPIIANGVHECIILSFSEACRGVHYFDQKDKNRTKAIQRLEKKQCLNVDWIDHTFQFQYPIQGSN